MLPPGTVTENGIKLAVDIIATDFGKLVAKICECLLRRGTLSRVQIARFTELPGDKVKKSLLVLVQHNCVQAFALEKEGGLEESMTVVTQYMALFDNIIHRLRFPKFLTISNELDKKCINILEGLLQHGRLTLTQILQRAVDFSEQGGSENQETYRESFIKLVNSHFIERCPAPEPLIPASVEEEPGATKRGPKSSKIAHREITLEERALAAAIPMEAQRFSITDDDGIDARDEIGNSSSGKKSGGKRKRVALERDSELDITCGKKEPIWHVNFEEFMRCLRNKVCVGYARAWWGNEAGTVLSAMLEATRSTENTVSVSLDTIFEEVIKYEEGHGMTLEHVRCYLEQVGCRSDIDELYTLDLNNIIKEAQNEEVEAIVLKRYGENAHRIFRLLPKNGRVLDTSKISANTFIERKDAVAILYKMWKDNYVHMEKVITGGPRPTELLLWRVNKDNIWEQVLDELYHAALNLRIRLTYEVDREREILKLDNTKRVGEIGKRYERLKKVRMLLGSSLMKLDDAIVLFRGF